MKNITIGLVEREWRLIASQHYYAERGDGDEYAFGGTPAEALARLEQREAALIPNFDRNLSETIIFLAIGAADYLRENPNFSLDRYGGYVGFLNDVVACAPMLERRWSRMDASSFSGVWPYDVVEIFGNEWAKAMLEGEDRRPEDMLDIIIADEMDRLQPHS